MPWVLHNAFLIRAGDRLGVVLDTERPFLGRIGEGFQYLSEVVKLALEEWAAMLMRMVGKPEVHRFASDIISALVWNSSHKLQVASWLYLSKLLHKLSKKEID
ncbi:unnamed protein product [Lupinus luteus]|uniref:Uncharacterized protein n=1 Tax=Lupinus luteus TaxID=3873 RepID=A0AAV1W1F2_LUPLU